MKISTIAIGLMVLFAATTIAIAEGPPDDKGKAILDPKIEIAYSSVSFLFFDLSETNNTWEITITWSENDPDGSGSIDVSETYSGVMVGNKNSPAYTVSFIAGTVADDGGEVTPPITIPGDCDLLYDVTVTATTFDGEIITASGIIDLNPILPV
ncbi:MAG: hypothetical protein E4G94_09435, partial [ANME-2 cluster archaeon]